MRIGHSGEYTGGGRWKNFPTWWHVLIDYEKGYMEAICREAHNLYHQEYVQSQEEGQSDKPPADQMEN